MSVRPFKGLALLAAALAWQVAAAPLFEDHPVLDATLTGPFDRLFEDKEASEYQPFLLQSGGVTHSIKVRLRGKSRRRVCEFPPLRLNFSKPETGQTVFAGQDKLKLATHCRNYDRGEQDMLEEYLAYRILNVLTDYSLRVRLLKWDYQDSEQQLPDGASPRLGFVIESLEEFAARTDLSPVTLPGVPVGRYDLEHANMVYVFQYLIGNPDWSLLKAEDEEGCCHNVELLERDGQIVFVPYDFDLAGLVNARYAFPDRSLRIRRVTQRLYLGICSDREAMRRAIRAVGGRREEILGLVQAVPGLEPGNAETAEKYLRRYFEMAADEEALLDTFERHCL